MSKVETVKIKSDAHPSGYITVNKADAHKHETEQKQPARSRSKKDGITEGES